MSIDILKYRFGKDSRSLMSVAEVNTLVEKEIGRKLVASYTYLDISSARGSVLPIEEMDADKVFESAMKRK